MSQGLAAVALLALSLNAAAVPGRIHRKRSPAGESAVQSGAQAGRTPPAQGRRGATAAESRTRELLEAIVRASSRDEPPPAERGQRPQQERASAVEDLQRAGTSETGDRGAVATGPPNASGPIERVRSSSGGAHRSAEGLAQQLGLKIHRVVVDPGHGGHDTGAIGRKATREKDVALAIALRLRDRLSRAGLEVILTRRDDTFVGLEQRARMANDARGDLFISIHCNSAPVRRLRGIETYTLNTSSDRYSIRLAARENASSDRAVSDLQYILADLATKANTEESSRLAARVQQSLIGQLRAKHRQVADLGTKEALFYVLLGVRMPAILVETSFLSHPEEERLLSSKAYQADIAAAIASGVQDFLASRQRLAKVD